MLQGLLSIFTFVIMHTMHKLLQNVKKKYVYYNFVIYNVTCQDSIVIRSSFQLIIKILIQNLDC